jgi:hypothetical protein
MGGLLGQSGANASSVATMSKLQQLYNYGVQQQVSPYVSGLNQRIEDRATNSQSMYRPVNDWGQYTTAMITQPAEYQLGEQIKILQHTNERFSSGRFAREAGAMQSTNDSIMSALGQKTNEERQAQMLAEESGLARQQNYSNMLTGMIAAPMQKKTQQSTTYTDNGLIGGIGGIGGIIGQQKGGG